MNYGLQLYSVRDSMPEHFEDTLARVANLGYRFVEFAGFFNHTAKEVASMLDRFGLVISGTHTGWEELKGDLLPATIRYHKEIGNKNIIIPGADLSTKEKLDDFIALINHVQPILKKEGIALGYHNHSHEFHPTAYGALIHQELEKRTDVEFEIDTFWAYHAGLDPVALLDRLYPRMRVIHIKDGNAQGQGFALGEGTAPVEEVRRAAIRFGLRMVVESETCKPTGLEEVGRCIRYLKSLDEKDYY